MGLISRICSIAIITLFILALTSLHDPGWTVYFTSSRTVDCDEQMGSWSLCCNTADHVRAIKQYIKTLSLWSYHTCHWSISSYICQAMRILIAQLIIASDWCDHRIYGSCKCWGHSRQMRDSIADSYSRLMACFISANPSGLVLNPCCHVRFFFVFFYHWTVIEAFRTAPPIKHSCCRNNCSLWNHFIHQK